MTTVDMSGADQHTFDTRTAAIEAAQVVDIDRDVAIERMARAIADSLDGGPFSDREWQQAFDEDVRAMYRDAASAALDAAPDTDNALRAVRMLHSPVEWFEWKDGVEGDVDRSKPLPPFCRECTDDEYVGAVEMGDGLDLGTGDLVDWPCATIAALRGVS